MILVGVLILLSMCVLTVVAYAARTYYVAKTNPLAAFVSNTKEASPTPTVVQTPSPTPTPTPVLTQTPTRTPMFTPMATTQEPTPTPAAQIVQEKFDSQRLNILMLGWDRSPERQNKSSALYRDEKNNYRSDVMMLLSIDFDKKRVDMISIPRDSYAAIYNTKGKWKINAAFAKGGSAEKDGFTYAMNTVSMLFGDIPIEYYVGVDMEGLKAVVDAMGGVDYDVEVEFTLNGRKTKKGMQHLDGQQVLDYCRARKNIEGGESSDVGRIQRQQKVLLAIFDQLKSANQLMNVPKIYAAVADKIYTNMNIEQITSLALFSQELNVEENMQRHTLKGSMLDAYGATFFVLDQTAKGELVKEVFGFEPPFDQAHDLKFVRSGRKYTAKPVEVKNSTPKPQKTVAPAADDDKNDNTKKEEPKKTSAPKTAKPDESVEVSSKSDEKPEKTKAPVKKTSKPRATKKPNEEPIHIPDENSDTPNMLG